MADRATVDGLLVQWGERLFPARSRVTHGRPMTLRQRAVHVRQRLQAAVQRRSAQAVVKVTGGGRGMRAIAAHMRYISKSGRLEMEDEKGLVLRGREALKALGQEWRLGGGYIPEESTRREAFNLMLSMPRRAADALSVQRAAREFAQATFPKNKYVMVLHDHQAQPHVHLSVRAEASDGRRLNPRKADLQRWRETFAERLREWGVEAEATARAMRGPARQPQALWRIRAAEGGRLREEGKGSGPANALVGSRQAAMQALHQVAKALTISEDVRDQHLATQVERYVRDVVSPARAPDHERQR